MFIAQGYLFAAPRTMVQRPCGQRFPAKRTMFSKENMKHNVSANVLVDALVETMFRYRCV